jgi:uncharacterized protein (TIGR00369 family)
MFDGLDPPPAAKLLGWRLIAIDEKEGAIEVGFDGKPEFANPAGVVQGGMLTAMLDDAMGPALLVASKGEHMAATIDLNVHFLRPVPIGPIRVKARTTQIGSRIAFLEAELFDAKGRLSARATASAALTASPFRKAGP